MVLDRKGMVGEWWENYFAMSPYYLRFLVGRLLWNRIKARFECLILLCLHSTDPSSSSSIIKFTSFPSVGRFFIGMVVSLVSFDFIGMGVADKRLPHGVFFGSLKCSCQS